MTVRTLIAALVGISGLAVPIVARLPVDVSWKIGSFTRPVDHPVITPDPRARFEDPILREPVAWEALHSFNPAAIVRKGKVYLLYRAEDASGAMGIGLHTSRIGLAISDDGVHFTKRATPVLYPDHDGQEAREWPGGVEDPRVVEAPDGRYIMTYTQWNRKTFSLGVASSRDLIHWTKHGPAFLGAAGGRYDQFKYKSGAILTRLSGDRLIAAKVKGRYWMYWGEGRVHLAHSPDLIRWTLVEDSPGVPHVLLAPRAGKFDSEFPEAGPPPVLTRRGVVVVYNAKNALRGGDPAIKGSGYSVGEALFDARDPARLLKRTDHPVLMPERAWERTGQYVEGTTFAEGLVRFRGRWMLYYGAADSVIGVAAGRPAR